MSKFGFPFAKAVNFVHFFRHLFFQTVFPFLLTGFPEVKTKTLRIDVYQRNIEFNFLDFIQNLRTFFSLSCHCAVHSQNFW